MSKNQRLEVGAFTAQLLEVRLPMGLMVQRIDLRGQGLALDSKPFQAQASRPGELEAYVTEDALAAFLEAQAPAGLKNFRVEIRDHRIYVSASAKVIVEIKAHAVCRLRIADGKQLFVDLESVDVMGGASVKNLVQTQLDRINPVLDVRDLPMNATLTSVEEDAGRIVLRGTVLPA